MAKPVFLHVIETQSEQLMVRVLGKGSIRGRTSTSWHQHYSFSVTYVDTVVDRGAVVLMPAGGGGPSHAAQYQ